MVAEVERKPLETRERGELRGEVRRVDLGRLKEEIKQ
jgi:hypothetical protein